MATRRDGDHGPGSGRPPQAHSAEAVRQGRIVLSTRPRRIVFLAGLVGFVLMVLAGALVA